MNQIPTVMKILCFIFCFLIPQSCHTNHVKLQQPTEKEKSFYITGFKYVTSVIREPFKSKAELDNYPFKSDKLTTFDTIHYNADKKAIIINYGSLIHKSYITVYNQIAMTKKDSAAMPLEIMGFKLFGAFETEETKGTIINTYYLNPEVKNDVFQVSHQFNIGNVLGVFLFTKDSMPSYSKNRELMEKLTNIQKKFRNRDTVNVIINR